MAFVCPAQQEAEAITQISTKVKEALHNLDKNVKVRVKPTCVSYCVPCCVPICDYPQEPHQEHRHEFDPPKIMVCYKEPSKKHRNKQKVEKYEKDVIRLQQSKSRELRASILYTGCQCEKRDGLQDDCPRTGCHGSPECLTSPPTCGPSEFSNGKHLGKKNKYSSKLGNHHKGGHHDELEEHHHPEARYKCFAASIEPPIVLPCSPCIPCPCPPCV